MSRRESFFAVLLLLCACAQAPTESGASCPTNGLAACDQTAPRLLRCEASQWVTYADCHGPKGCTSTGDTADCDTSGNTRGDRCPPTSEGKVRCDPDGGLEILRCVDGGLVGIFTCPPGTWCGVTDAGLSCY